MSFDYTPILTIVNDLLPTFGMPCTAETTSSEASPSNPTGEPTTVTTSGSAVLDEIKKPFGDFSNTIEIGDMVLVATASLELQTGSVVDLNGDKWRVIDPRPIKPANLLLGYQSHVRRA